MCPSSCLKTPCDVTGLENDPKFITRVRGTQPPPEGKNAHAPLSFHGRTEKTTAVFALLHDASWAPRCLKLTFA